MSSETKREPSPRGSGRRRDPAKRDPSTDVWRLVVSLGIGTENPHNPASFASGL